MVKSIMSCTESTDSTRLRVIQINDVYELDNLPRLKTLVNEWKNLRSTEGSLPNATIVICCGDFVAPSLLSSLDEGRAMVDCLNECGITHVCLGNHEADISLAALNDRFAQSKFLWINSNVAQKRANREDRSPSSSFPSDLPEYCVLSVGGDGSTADGSSTRPSYTVVLLGLLTHDPSLYRPNAFGGADSIEIVPILERTKQLLEEFYGSRDETSTTNRPHLIIPLTHQSVQEDRVFARTFGQFFPVVCGGHDHEVYNECIVPGELPTLVEPPLCYESCRVVKAGMDADNAVVIDFVWNDGPETSETNTPKVTVEVIPTSNYEPDPDLLLRVRKHQSMLQDLEQAKLFRISDWATPSGESKDLIQPFSTVNNRFQASTGTTALCTMLQMGLRSTCCILNAGTVRGSKVYDSTSYFTWADLKNEIPFSTDMTVCSVPGSVLEAMIHNSRKGSYQNPPVTSGGYLHTCSNIEINDSNEDFRIISIAGVPYDPSKSYLTALPMQFFAGIDNHVPLLEWVATTGIPFSSDEATVPAKMVLVQVFAATLWLQMGSFAEIDLNHDGSISREEIRTRLLNLYGHSEHVADLIVDNVFSICDLDGDGTISRLEMMICQYVATDMLKHVGTKDEIRVIKDIVLNVLGDRMANVSSYEDVSRLVEELRNTIDVHGDGSINRDEIAQIFKGNIQRGNDLLR